MHEHREEERIMKNVSTIKTFIPMRRLAINYITFLRTFMLIPFRWHTISKRQNQFFIKSNILNQSPHTHMSPNANERCSTWLYKNVCDNIFAALVPSNFEKKPNKIADSILFTSNNNNSQKIIYKQITTTI